MALQFQMEVFRAFKYLGDFLLFLDKVTNYAKLIRIGSSTSLRPETYVDFYVNLICFNALPRVFYAWHVLAELTASMIESQETQPINLLKP